MSTFEVQGALSWIQKTEGSAEGTAAQVRDCVFLMGARVLSEDKGRHLGSGKLTVKSVFLLWDCRRVARQL